MPLEISGMPLNGCCPADYFWTPGIDLFATRLNKQLAIRYASWISDPDSVIIDALSFSWEN